MIGLGAAAALIGLGWIVLAHNAPRQAAAPPAVAVPTVVAPPAVETAPPPPELSVDELLARSPPHVGAPANLPPQIAAAPPAAAPATPQAAAPDPAPPMDRYDVTVRVEKGDTLEKLLAELDFAPSELEKATDALRTALRGPKPVEGKGRNAKAIYARKLRAWQAPIRLPVGEAVEVTVGTPKRTDGLPILLDLSIRPTMTREITLHRLDNGEFDAKERVYKVVTKLMRASGVVNRSLRASYIAAGVPPAAAYEALRAFSYDLDLQRDVKRGDHFTVLLEQAFTSDGRQVGSGRVVSAELKLSGKRTASVHRFRPHGGADQFWLPNGQSVVKSLIRTPMDLRRMSSRFGMRDHPILGFSSMHTGVDFAAPYGTPVIAAGNGVVKQAGPNGGYGNWVLIAHDSRISTGYAHLARFAPGIRPGARVRQGQVVGFVGSTGLSTGPHLHYELHTNGRPVNPITHRAAVRGALHGKDLVAFRAQVAKTNRERNSAPVLVARADSDSGDAVRATVTPVRSRSRPPASRPMQLAYLVDSVEMPSPSASPRPQVTPSRTRPATKPHVGFKQRSAITSVKSFKPRTVVKKKRSGIKSRKAVKPRAAVKKRTAVRPHRAVTPKTAVKQRTLVAQRRDGKLRRSGHRHRVGHRR
ncbi:MAG: peptidoglycan DD-metalloendopeptidase family protein [Reyranellaceae bacterium]